MKRTRSITTTVTVQPSDVEFVPKLGEVPNETMLQRTRRQTMFRVRKFYSDPARLLAKKLQMREYRKRLKQMKTE